MPAPSRPRALDFDEDRPVRTERPEARVLAERVDRLDGADIAGAVPHMSQYPLTIVPPQPVSAHVCPSPEPWCATDVSAAAVAGAVPQVSQYPPTMAPSQPGSVHVCPSPEFICATGVSADTVVASVGAVPQTTQYPSSMVPPHPGSLQVIFPAPISPR
ncbi:hypothetical protein ACQP1G_23615 [Nocardia sp. CA-107356]|uniref:hypothetical protein n=1 Tax=Nocardia sp. CA-107356 TaxID=3239972 RepID=UPI003D944121